MRLSPGALYLNVRNRIQHGFRVAWYRDLVRPRILKSAPLSQTNSDACEIHALTCESDWINLIWTLKSFYLVSGKDYKLCIHEDGTLSHKALQALRFHFPAARIVQRVTADSHAEEFKAEYPMAFEFRQRHPLSLKLIDFPAFLEAERMLLLDSDVLFFADPVTLIERIEDPHYKKNSFNEDVETAYSVDREKLEKLLGFAVAERFNSGLGLVHKASVDMAIIEELLKTPGVLDGHFWRIEQTLFALLSSRFGVELLPSEYRVSLTPGSENRPARHYVGAVRHQFYGEGIPRLLRETQILSSQV